MMGRNFKMSCRENAKKWFERLLEELINAISIEYPILLKILRVSWYREVKSCHQNANDNVDGIDNIYLSMRSVKI